MTSPLAALPDEVLLRALTYADKRDVFAAAGTYRRWRGIIHGEKSAPLWKGLVEAYHPDLLQAASSVTSAGRTRSLGLRG